MLASALLLAYIQVSPWKPVLQKIGQEVSSIESQGKPVTTRRFQQAFIRLGYRVPTEWYDHNGIDLAMGTELLPLPDGTGFIALLSTNGSHGVLSSWCLVWFAKSGVPTLLEEGKDLFGAFEPVTAQRAHGRIVVLGRSHWISNSPGVVAASYRLAGSSVRAAKRIVSEYEAWDVPVLRWSPKSKAIQPVRVVSRTYPNHLTASHATSNRSYEEQWSFPNGVPRRDWLKLRDTGYNVLDELTGALIRGDRRSVESRCANRSLANELWNRRGRLVDGSRDATFRRSRSDLDATEIGVEGIGLTFLFGKRSGRTVVIGLRPFKAILG